MRHRLLIVIALIVLVAIGAAALVAANVMGEQRVEDHGRRPANAQPRNTHGPQDEFHRFRLGAIDGERLEPNRDDFAARTASDGPLLLFLPATRAKPAQYQRFLTTALGDGYHVLGLDYWNLGKTLSGTCEADPQCYGQVQRNRFDGTRQSEFSTVSPAGSIVSRFRDAITHLDDVDPKGGWGRFVASNEDIAWQDIVVAGHSQGGGEAAYIAHIRPVLGALMFSSPVESLGPAHAAWMDRPGRTPASRMYAIDDVRDVFGPRIRGSWRVLGLDAPATTGGPDGPWRTDTAPPPDGWEPHAILTDISVGTPAESHSRTIKDSTPLAADGQPRMLALWQWLLRRFPLPVEPGPQPGATDVPQAAPTTSSGTS
ncbi:BPSS1187 family protein [Curtobacterium sp. RRHDQ66]|uniref:BPSS1187 family protein n=1 Tax=Curtobacterium guangdongense TaxID=3413380 RepID=UPI003BEF9ADF